MQVAAVEAGFGSVELTEEDLCDSATVPSGVTLVERPEQGGGQNGSGVVVELRDVEGALLVEYVPTSGQCRIHARTVQLRAETDLDLRAGRRVQIQGEQGVVLRSGESSVELEPTRVGLFAARVETKARRLVQTAGEIETRARQVFERARESFREVEDLAQTRAGRVRVVATEALRMLGRQAVVKAREDLKLRGERIYLE